MRLMTRDEVRGAIVNLDPPETRIRLPAGFDDVAWHKVDYLGWRDPRAPLNAYLVTEVDGNAFGVLLRQNPSQAALGSRAVMCDLCRFTRRFNEVALFTARRPSKDKRQRLSSFGLHVCTDLDCPANAARKPVVGPLDPPAAQIITARREGLRTRTISFLRSVSDTERIVRRRD